MRSLFEKVLAVMPVEVSRPIWDRYVEFETAMVSNGGDLATVAKVEARRAQAFPEAPFVEMKGLLSISHRYAFLDLKPPSKSDQSFLEMYGATKRAGSGGAAEENGDHSGEHTMAMGPNHVFTGPTVFPGLEGGLIDVDRYGSEHFETEYLCRARFLTTVSLFRVVPTDKFLVLHSQIS